MQLKPRGERNPPFPHRIHPKDVQYCKHLKELFWSWCLCFLIMTSFAYLVVEIIHPLYQSTDVDFPSCERCNRATSSILDANLSLFQTVIVGDDWGEVALPVINNFPWSAALLVGAYLTIVFGVLNLIIAVMDAKPCLKGGTFQNVFTKGRSNMPTGNPRFLYD